MKTGAKLHVLNVHYIRYMSGAVDNLSPQEEVQNLIEKTHDLIGKHQPHDPVDYQVHISDGGRLYEQIHKYMEHVSASLVIMGASSRRGDTSGFVLSALEKLLLEAKYPVLVVTQDARKSYGDIAVYAPSESPIIKALNILTPLAKNSKITIYGFLTKPIKGMGVLAWFRKKYNQHKKERLCRKIRNIFKGYNFSKKKLAFLKRKQSTLLEFFKEVPNMNIDILACRPLKNNLISDKPEPELRRVLANPPCDLLMIGRE